MAFIVKIRAAATSPDSMTESTKLSSEDKERALHVLRHLSEDCFTADEVSNIKNNLLADGGFTVPGPRGEPDENLALKK